ncbi:SprT family zinc-dependent metalloprotease [Asticcacaulis sp. SL142]|uniref:M48 family metallopeptidase n=1 Tax=Asticcacaulis sp. SL142 TaxID=2995155 RepID=UPI00226D36D7|nr:SprT family zinc-dependent metalloprotease [Asticcacaulis sp. SL142]WAC48454.1 SprT family zinc-dependent metalloprotease [Asticcacaulis sp. SL142]
MNHIQIGKVTIPYDVRRSSSAQKKSIIVRPHHVEVVAPDTAPESDISAFVHKKRHWVFDKLTEMNERLAYLERHSYHRLQSGAKIRFRGRNAKLTIRRADVADFDIQFNGGFQITAPSHISDADLDAALSNRMIEWFKAYLEKDASTLVRRYEKALSLTTKGVQIIHSDTLWGSLTRGGIVRINWHLIEAPRPVLEYVVLHEMCHLTHRNHTNAFWALVTQHMPDYPVRKRWLENMMPSFKL